MILKDVLGYSLDEISDMLDLTVPAVKAALHRGRSNLREHSAETTADMRPPRTISPTLARYADLFNARDWDAVRAMLVDEVKLDLVSRERRCSGRRDRLRVRNSPSCLAPLTSQLLTALAGCCQW